MLKLDFVVLQLANLSLQVLYMAVLAFQDLKGTLSSMQLSTSFSSLLVKRMLDSCGLCGTRSLGGPVAWLMESRL